MRLNNYLGEPIKVKDVLTAYDISKTYQKQAIDALGNSRLTGKQKEEALRFASKQSNANISYNVYASDGTKGIKQNSGNSPHILGDNKNAVFFGPLTGELHVLKSEK